MVRGKQEPMARTPSTSKVVMHGQSSQIVGIVGGSCAGKTWLSERLIEAFGDQATRFSLDDFYLDRSHLPAGRRGRVNFDHPRSIDWGRLEQALRDCAKGHAASIP